MYSFLFVVISAKVCVRKLSAGCTPELLGGLTEALLEKLGELERIVETEAVRNLLHGAEGLGLQKLMCHIELYVYLIAVNALAGDPLELFRERSGLESCDLCGFIDGEEPFGRKPEASENRIDSVNTGNIGRIASVVKLGYQGMSKGVHPHILQTLSAQNM